MTRVKAVHRPSDYPGEADETTRRDLAALFDYMFPQAEQPEIDRSHAGIAIAAQNPALALNLAKLSAFMARDMAWCQRRDNRELAILTLNLHFRSGFSIRARLPQVQAAGIGNDMVEAIPHWRTSQLFNEEQRLVIEYTNAVVSGNVPAELFGRVVEKYGEKEAVEFTSVVGLWSLWAMLINATGPEPEPEND
jgi:alkylhydroperoxidase family enzyme